MKIDHFNIEIFSGILIVSSKKNVTLDDLKDIRETMELSTGRKYDYGMYRDIVGYYDGYDFVNNISVYCGTMKEETSLEKLLAYRDEKIKNSSS